MRSAPTFTMQCKEANIAKEIKALLAPNGERLVLALNAHALNSDIIYFHFLGSVPNMHSAHVFITIINVHRGILVKNRGQLVSLGLEKWFIVHLLLYKQVLTQMVTKRAVAI
jgi:hypothetical protein